LEHKVALRMKGFHCYSKFARHSPTLPMALAQEFAVMQDAYYGCQHGYVY
jgi:hypothetical protein